MSRRKYSDADKRQWAEMIEAGVRPSVIARRFNCSIGVINWNCLALGADPPKPTRPLRPDQYLRHPVVKRGNHQVKAFTPAEDAKLIALDLDGAKHSEMARALGRRANSIKGRLMTLARRDRRQEGA